METFEPGESIATFLDRKGERRAGSWIKVSDGPSGWVMVNYDDDKGDDKDDATLRTNVALCGIQAYLKVKLMSEVHIFLRWCFMST